METALKIAFATTDMETVNQHFGSAKSFAIYAVDMEDAQLLEAVEFGVLSQDGNEDKLSVKLDLLDGCAAVYCQAVGGSAINQLIARGIQPVKVHEGGKIKDLIVDLQNEMKAGPSSWLAKAINQHKSPDPDRFNRMEDEGWDE
ncbi:MAG: nitrogen fixation protein NifX [Methylobacter sp.]